jgi:hypothetical protein
MSENHEFPRVPRRPKLFPEAPAPLEPAPPPRPVFRLRTEAPAPSEGPSKDKLRETFFINWKASNPAGTIDSEDFERAYGDFQVRQREAKIHPADREPAAPLRPMVIQAIVIAFLLLAGGVAVFKFLGARPRGPNPPAAAAPSSSPR